MSWGGRGGPPQRFPVGTRTCIAGAGFAETAGAWQARPRARHRPADAHDSLCGTGAGTFKSTDAGGLWTPVNTGFPDSTEVTALAIDPTTPTTLYAGTFDAGVFKSTDGGDSWSIVTTTPTPTPTCVGDCD